MRIGNFEFYGDYLFLFVGVALIVFSVVMLTITDMNRDNAIEELGCK